MDKSGLLFYSEYERFYEMAGSSAAFAGFCREAFGEDFSQDGFGDIRQTDRIIEYIPRGGRILDIGCGNGKMLGYLQKRTGAYICGFDYSENAIAAARERFTENAEFRTGVIGETDYPPESFDVVTSMDTMYFAPDMTAFVGQIMGWLKKGGVLFVCYQEGDVMPRTENAHTTAFARALAENGLTYEVSDITRESYEILARKRRAALAYKERFRQEGSAEWFGLFMSQTEPAGLPYEEFSRCMARYIYTVRRG